MLKADLHVHSNASDGKLSPADVIRKAVKNEVVILALTDHDTLAGIDEAKETAAGYPGFKLIPGVEINTDVAGGEAHILGYFVDHTNPELGSLLSEMRSSRHDRGRRMLEKLESLGMPLSWERVQEIGKTDSIGRPHIAQAMLEKGYVSSLKEAFDRYISFGGPAYVERTKVSPAQATELIIKAGGLPALAHPFTISEPEELVRDLKEHGLVGVEVYYGGYSQTEVKRLLAITEKYSLLATGGSDYHGLDEGTETGMGESGLPLECAMAIVERGDRRTGQSEFQLIC